MPFDNGKRVEAPAPEARVETPLTHTQPHTDSETTAIAQELAVAPYRAYFGDLSTEDKGKLDYILSHLNGEGKLEPEEVVAKIRKIDGSFGYADAEKRLDKVYRYVKLANQTRELLLENL